MTEPPTQNLWLFLWYSQRCLGNVALLRSLIELNSLPLREPCVLPGLHPSDWISWGKEVRDRNPMNPSPPQGQGDGRCLQVVWGRRRGPRRVVPIESRASFPGEKASLARLRVHSRGALLGRISPAQEFPLVAGGSGICRRSLWTCRYLPGDDVCGCAVIPRQAAENRRWLCPSCGHRGAWMGWAELQALHLPQLAPHLSGALLQLWTPSTGSLCTLSVWAGSV